MPNSRIFCSGQLGLECLGFCSAAYSIQRIGSGHVYLVDLISVLTTASKAVSHYVFDLIHYVFAS